MIAGPAVRLLRVAGALGDGSGAYLPLAKAVARAAAGAGAAEIGGVVAASFSNPNRFPSLAVEVASELGLGTGAPALDLQLACSAWPYALYVAGRLASDLGRRILVLDGDVQSPLVDRADPATGAIFSDAFTAAVIEAEPGATAPFDFYSRRDESLTCAAAGPIRMDGFKVFAFVATEVSAFLRRFDRREFDFFVPHQAHPYMIRQLARSLQLADVLLTLPEAVKNPGGCSVPLTLAWASAEVRQSLCGRRALVAGFGAGLSAAATVVQFAPDFVAERLS